MPDFHESFTAAVREVCEGMLTEITVPRFPPHRPPTAFQNGLPTLFLHAPALICREWFHLTGIHCRTHANLTWTNLSQSHTSSRWIQRSTHNWMFQLCGDRYRCLCTGCFCKGRSLKVGENLNMGKERGDIEVPYKRQLDGQGFGFTRQAQRMELLASLYLQFRNTHAKNANNGNWWMLCHRIYSFLTTEAMSLQPITALKIHINKLEIRAQLSFHPSHSWFEHLKWPFQGKFSTFHRQGPS